MGTTPGAMFGGRRPSPWAAAADILAPLPDPYRDDLIGWHADRLAGFFWAKQREVAQSLVDNRYTAVPSCFDSGKSYLASCAACWWLDTHPVGTAFVVTTAPTDPQVKAILWREIHKRFDDALKVTDPDGNPGRPLPGRVTQDAQWKIENKLVAFGRKPADYDEAAFQGIHERYVLVIIDEADGVPQSIYDAADGLVTNEDSRMLAIGNPMNPVGPFAVACKPGSGWNVVRISAFDTPAFTGEVVPDYLPPLLVSRTWVTERMKRWGTKSPRYISKVLGEFPEVTDDSLIEPGWVESAQRRSLRPDRTDATLSCDVARYGEDETVIGLREGCRFQVLKAIGKGSTMATAGLVGAEVEDHISRPIVNVDDTGVGGGVTDRLMELDYEVGAFNGGDAALNPKKFGNRRAEIYWALREEFRIGNVDIDPDDEDLAAQLVSIKYRLDSKGRIFIESKDDMKGRGLPSPDRADAMAMAFAVIAPAINQDQFGRGTTITGDLLTRAM